LRSVLIHYVLLIGETYAALKLEPKFAMVNEIIGWNGYET